MRTYPSKEQWERIYRQLMTLQTMPDVHRLDGDGFTIYKATNAKTGHATHFSITIKPTATPAPPSKRARPTQPAKSGPARATGRAPKK